METLIRVVWRLDAELADADWREPRLAESFPDIFSMFSFLQPPASVFSCDDSDLARAARAWTGKEVESALPRELKSYFDAWLSVPKEAARFVEFLRGVPGFASSIEVHGATGIESKRVTPVPVTPSKRYLGSSAEWGVDAEAAWLEAGGTGAWGPPDSPSRVHLVDLEGGADLSHVDLAGRVTCLGPNVLDEAHGTAVLGILVPEHQNGRRLRGLVPAAKVAIAPTPYVPGQVKAEEATLWCVASNCPRGSVILVERVVRRLLRVSGSGEPVYSDELPLEAIGSAREAIAAVVGLGINVVECAGNSNADLDCEVGSDCGAILVGASDPASGRKSSFSNHGDRVHLHSWGNSVITAGCENCPPPCNPIDSYTLFNGTSSAGAIVAGVVASAIGLVAAANKPLEPRELRQKLYDTGYYKTADTAGDRVGRHPNLAQFIEQYVKGGVS